MKQKLFTLLLAVAASVGTMFAVKVQIGDLYYNLDATNQTAEVTRQNSGKYSGNIVIPSSVTNNSVTYSVTNIGDMAFSSCTGLTSVTIPNSVTSIGSSAFSSCTGLTSVTIPNSVTNIGNDAFRGCTGLTSVTIGNSVISIGNDAFSGCSGLTSVTISNSLTVIGWNAFMYCTGLTSVTIPNSVTKISYGAFAYCTGLTSIEIPNSVTSIENDSFNGCSSLTDIYATCGDLERIKMLVRREYQDKVKYVPLPYIITINATNGNVTYPQTMCDDMSLNATPEYGYHFVQWSDGLKDNPRVIELTQDTTFTAEFARNPTITYVYDSQMGSVTGPATTATGIAAENITFNATPNYGYHFVQWSDGNTENPRTIWLSQDTTFTAEFAKNTYTITTKSSNPQWGTTAGDNSALYLDEVKISAIPNYGYHFVRWNDNNRSNPRTVSVTEDKTFIATFAKNIYGVNKQCNGEQGSIIGVSQAEYLDYVTLTAVPNYGYHFTQWSDGLKDNPRTIVLTQDTTFTAEFAPNRVGTCGKDLALVWSYDPTNKVLTIGNAGSFTENMQFGVEAPNEMEELVIGNSVTAIGANAFAGIETLKKVSIGESVKTIGEQAFYNCVNIETIFNYRPTPTNTYSNAFDGVDKFECELYVLKNSVDMYKAAAVWRDFYYTYAIGAEEATVTTNDVTVEPQDNAVTVTWPTSENAASYTIQITKDGEVFCTLIFNANGQLTGIAFAPSRDGQAHAPAAIMTAKGMQFTVTGLDSGTHYALTLQAKDSQETVLASYSSEFTTTGHNAPQGLDEISSSLQGGDRGRLILHNGQIYILRGDKVYTMTGQEVK